MIRKLNTAGLCAAAVLSIAAAPRAFGQAAPAPAAGPAPDTQGDLVVLSPFIVSASEDKGYRASSTLAGTRIRTDLKDVGSAISVVTSQFLEDTGAKSSQDLLVYTTNTAVAGTGGNFVGTTNLGDNGRRVSVQQNTSVRGLGSADNARDFFITNIPWDGYNVDRIDIQRGANSILFGLGSPAGIVNSGVAGAMLRNENKVEVRVSSYGALRGSASFNRVLLPDELAVRVSWLNDHTKYQQKPAFNDDKRVFAAVRWDPKFLSRGGSHLSLTANYEKGDIEANRPRTTPPIDAASPWFTDPQLIALRQAGGLDPYLASVSSTATSGIRQGARLTSDANYIPALFAAARVFDQPVAYYSTVDASTPDYVATNSAWWGAAFNGSTNSYVTNFAQYAVNAGLAGQGDGIYSAKTLADPSFFDFYKNLLDGDNKREWQNFENFNAHLSHTFLNNRLGYDVAYDHQNYSDGQWAMLSGNAQGITIDPNGWLVRRSSDNSDSIANPNFGKAMVLSDSSNNNDRRIERDAYRAQIFGEFRFSDVMEKSTLSNILGTHRFTGLISGQKTDTLTRNWTGYITDPSFATTYYRPGEAVKPATDAIRAVATATYLSGSPLTTMDGANISRLRAVQSPHFNQTWVYDSVAGTPESGWRQVPVTVLNQDGGDKSLLYANGNWQNEKIDSRVAVWQGYMFDGAVVPMFGYRKDTVVGRQSSPPKSSGGYFGEALVDSPAWVLPEEGTRGYSKQSGNTKSYGLVLHTPKFINAKLPWGTRFSVFYNKSQNWQPNAGRVDMYGDVLPAPSGDTKDYGFMVSFLDERIVLRVNKYKSSVTNAALPALGGLYMFGYAETWGDEFATNIRNQVSGFSPWGPQQTTAQVLEEQKLVVDYWFSHPVDRQADLFKAWSHTAGGSGQSTPAGLTAIGDTISRGTEFELTAQITKNWSLTANAAKSEATTLNLAGNYRAFAEERYKFYNTVIGTQTWSDGTTHQIRAGDIPFWPGSFNPATGIGNGGSNAPGNLLVNKWTAEFYGNYKMRRLLEGQPVPEVRPWAFNLVTNYSFSDGPFKGFNVGGAYRWLGDYTLGYAYDATAGKYLLDQPYKAGGEDHIDLWIGYERNLTEKLKWRIQLNVRNAFESNNLVPFTAEPRVYQNGVKVREFQTAASRIAEGMSWSLSNTFTF